MVKFFSQGRWTAEEHSSYLKGVTSNSKWEKITEIVGTRNADQCRSHHQKFSLQQSRASENQFRKKISCSIDKSTQYEPPVTFYAFKPVYLINSEESFRLSEDNTFTLEIEASENDFRFDIIDYDEFMTD